MIVACLPDTDVGRRFPDGAFRIDATPETAIEQRGRRRAALRRRPLARPALRGAGHRAGAHRSGCASPGSSSGAAPAAVPPSRRAVCSRCGRGRALLARHDRSAGAGGAGVGGCCRALAAILPWLAHDAWIHYLAPRGLEQYSGGGWGTRDVCQGPVELLLALGRAAPVRDLLLRVFRNQNADGDWPQWFMFFERERGIRAGDSHGDIVFWPLLALAQYLLASGDARVARRGRCRSSIPRATRRREHDSVLAHVERALGADRAARDSRARAWRPTATATGTTRCSRPTRRSPSELCSAWTVTLHHQTIDDAGAGAAPRRPRGARRRRSRRRWPASATTSSACSLPTASSPARALSRRRRTWSTGCIRATAKPACTTACCRWSTRSWRTCSRASRPRGTSS